MSESYEKWVCEQCGHRVSEDSCGFLFSSGRVLSCERCPNPVEKAEPLLNVAESKQLEFDFTYHVTK